MPNRIQRSRAKGWRIPAGAIYVGRPTRWGNPFIVGRDVERLAHYYDFRKNVDLWTDWPVADAATAVEAYRAMRCTGTFLDDIKGELRGHDLACWCRLDQPCHADVLLELANA